MRMQSGFLTDKMMLHMPPKHGITTSEGRDILGSVVEIGMLNQARLQEVLDYDRKTGAFTWREEAGGRLDGKKAGTLKANHLHITIDGKVYMGPRLAWLYEHGEWPTSLLRFNDGNSANIAISNLRVSVPNSERLKDKAAQRAYKDDLRARAGQLTQETLKEILRYDSETGVFSWRATGSGRVQGQPAGTVWVTGYRMIRVFGQDHQAARLAWLYVTGTLPEGRIKFDNEDQTDCRFANLRLARTRQEHQVRFRERHPEANRQFMYNKLYQGMTIAAYNVRFAAQGGVCAICEKPETDQDNTGTGNVRNLNVDHDHTTNAVRGLLCSSCNRGLGLFADNPYRLDAAAAYLRHHLKKKEVA